MAMEIDNDLFFASDEDTQKGKFLVFPVAKEDFAIEIRYVTEIIGIQPIIQIPEMPSYIKGIINLRGRIIPVIDLRLRFLLDEKEYNDRTCIVVVDTEDTGFGLIVDSVSDVVTVAEEDIISHDETSIDKGNQYINKIIRSEGGAKLIIDVKRFLKSNDKASFKKATAQVAGD